MFTVVIGLFCPLVTGCYYLQLISMHVTLPHSLLFLLSLLLGDLVCVAAGHTASVKDVRWISGSKLGPGSSTVRLGVFAGISQQELNHILYGEHLVCLASDWLEVNAVGTQLMF